MVALYDVPRDHGGLTAPYFNSGVMVLSRRHYPMLSLPEAGCLYTYPLFEQTYLNARVRKLACLSMNSLRSLTISRITMGSGRWTGAMAG